MEADVRVFRDHLTKLAVCVKCHLAANDNAKLSSEIIITGK
jgi:hypothetical protein